MNVCQICENQDGNTVHKAREMLFGFRDYFNYVECARCGCVQIEEVPIDLGKYYPEEYWGDNTQKFREDKLTLLRRWIRKRRTQYYLEKSSMVGYWLSILSQPSPVPVFSGWQWIQHFQKMGIKTSSPILDVGCGSGAFLRFLWGEGFSNLTGIDPNAAGNYDCKGWSILKKELSELNGKFDVITMHHSFEHMKNPRRVLEQANLLLSSGQHLIVRIPLAAAAWRRYGTNWAQLDPPRHLFLHTLKSINLLTDQTGFEIREIEFDSNEFQFWASEQYEKDIPLKSPESYLIDPSKSIFKKDDIEDFRKLSIQLNEEHQGDQACFCLTKK